MTWALTAARLGQATQRRRESVYREAKALRQRTGVSLKVCLTVARRHLHDPVAQDAAIRQRGCCVGSTRS